MAESCIQSIRFTDDDVVNADEWAHEHDEDQKCYVFHKDGSVVGVAFGYEEYEAWDALAKSGKLDSFLVPEGDEDEEREDSYVYAGVGCKAYDVESVSVFVIERQIPPSFCASLNDFMKESLRHG